MHSRRSQRQARIHLKGDLYLLFWLGCACDPDWFGSWRRRRVSTLRLGRRGRRKKLEGGGQVVPWRIGGLLKDVMTFSLSTLRLDVIDCNVHFRAFFVSQGSSGKQRLDDYWLSLAGTSLVRFQPTVSEPPSLTDQLIGYWGWEGLMSSVCCEFGTTYWMCAWAYCHFCLMPKSHLNSVTKNVMCLSHNLQTRRGGDRSNSKYQIQDARNFSHLSAFHCWDVDHHSRCDNPWDLNFTDLSLLLPLILMQFSDQ